MSKIDSTISGFSEKRNKLIALFLEVDDDNFIPYQVMSELIDEDVSKSRGYSIMDSARNYVLKNHSVIFHTKRGGGLIKSSEEDKIKKPKAREAVIKRHIHKARVEVGAIDTTRVSERIAADVNIRKEFYAAVEARWSLPEQKQLSPKAGRVQREVEKTSIEDDLKRAVGSVKKFNQV